MKSGVSLQNEFIRHYTFLGRENINYKGLLYASFGPNKLTNEDGTKGRGRKQEICNCRIRCSKARYWTCWCRITTLPPSHPMFVSENDKLHKFPSYKRACCVANAAWTWRLGLTLWSALTQLVIRSRFSQRLTICFGNFSGSRKKVNLGSAHSQICYRHIAHTAANN